MKLLPNLEKKEIALGVLMFTLIFLLNFSFSIILKGLFLKLILWLFSPLNKITTSPCQKKKKKTNLYQRIFRKPWDSICVYHIWGLMSLSNIELKWSHRIPLWSKQHQQTWFMKQQIIIKTCTDKSMSSQTGTKNGRTTVQTENLKTIRHQLYWVTFHITHCCVHTALIAVNASQPWATLVISLRYITHYMSNALIVNVLSQVDWITR